MALTRAEQALPLYWSLGKALAGAPGPLLAQRGSGQQ
jgi:hypothetical protein